MNSEIISLIGIILGLGLIILFAFRGYPILITAPVIVMLVAVISGLNPITTLTGPYSQGLASFAQKNCLIFITSAVFGKIMGDSGAAKVIALKMAGIAKKTKDPFKRKFIGVMSIVALGAVLTIGGVTSFIIWFTTVVIAKEIFEELDIPWNLYICIILGSTQFTMTMLPGSPSVQNLVPTTYLGTTAMAGPIIGLYASAWAIALGTLYVYIAVKKEVKAGHGFYPEGEAISKAAMTPSRDTQLPLWKCLLPSIVLLIVLDVFKQPAVEALIIAIVVSVILYRKELENLTTTFAKGAESAIISLLTVCTMTGFGTAMASTKGYEFIMSGLSNIPGPPIVQLIIAVNIAAAFTGSATSGLGIAMEQLADYFISLGLNVEVIHRMACISSGGLDSLPHNSGIYNAFSISKLNHKLAYKHYFWLTVVITVSVSILCIPLVQMGIV